MGKIGIGVGVFIGGMCLTSHAFAGLDAMDDEALRTSSGQALFTSQFIDTGGSNTNTNTSFYRINLNTEMRLNANVNELKLGCGGVNGANACDIDIGQLRLMGNDGNGGPGDEVTSDFIMNNPYIELAIDNNASDSSRRVTGFRIGAQSVNGYMGIGKDASTGDGSDSGINSLSGYMNVDMQGSIDATVCSGGVNGSRTGCSGSWWWPSFALFTTKGTFQQSTQVSGQRMSSIAVNGLKVSTSLGTITSNINESLKYVHGINVVSPDFFMSWQSQDMNWQNVSDSSFPSAGVQTAKRGWWMSLPSVEMHNLYTHTYLSSGEGIGGILGLTLNFSNLDLGQNPPSNCYGGRAFC